MLAAVLATRARPCSPRTGLTLAWPGSRPFSKRQAEEPAKQELIAHAIRAVTGASLRLAHELRADHEASSPPPPAGRRAALSESELVARFMDRVRRRGAPPDEPEPPSQETALMPQPPNLQKMLQQAQEMMAAQQEAQESLKDERVEASAGGGMVKVVMTGDLRVETLAIEPDAVDPEDVEMLQDLVVAAVNEAIRSARSCRSASSAARRAAAGLRPDERARALGLGGLAAARRLGAVAAACRAGCPAAGGNRAARRASSARGSRCSLRRSSGWSRSSRSSRGSATAPPSGSRSTCCAPRPRTRSRSRRRSATSRRRSRLCEICFNLAEGPRCAICLDERRDTSVICVVEEPADVIPIERTHEYRGRYHVLGGALSPIDGVEPEDLKIAQLVRRASPPRACARSSSPRTRRPPARRPPCTSPPALHERAPEVAVTRLASGLPVGGDLEYADEVTLGRAFAGRRAL